MRFLVKIYRNAEDYSALAPDLPGCVAAADSIEEVRNLIAEAITLHLEMMERSGETIPNPSKHVKIAVDELADEELCTWVEVSKPQPVSMHKR